MYSTRGSKALPPARALRVARILAFASACLLTAAASAHHSFSMFESTREVSLAGTVKELQWTNPHCFIQLLVPGSGTTSEWSIEMASPLHLVRRGWTPGLIKPGDKVTIVVHPMRDGSTGGAFVSGTGPDGKPLGEGAQR